MATVVTMNLDRSSIRAGQPCNVQVGVNNTGANPIAVTNIQLSVTNPANTSTPTANFPVSIVNPNPDYRGAGGAGTGAPNVTNTYVNASATVYFPFQITSFAPQKPGASPVGLLINPIVTDNTNGATAGYTSTPTMGNFGTLTPAASGGSLATATYLLKLTAVGPSGESLPCAESAGQAVTGPSGKITVNFTPFSGATAYNLYYTTGSTGTEANYVQFVQTTSPISFTTTTGNVSASPPSSSTFANLAVKPVLDNAQ